MNQMNRKALILSIPMILAVLLLGGWFFMREPKSVPESQNQPVVKENPPQNAGNLQPPANIDTSIDTSHWKTYRNEEYGFELKYPAEWVVFDDYPNREAIFLSLPENDIHRVDGVMIYMRSTASLIEEETMKSMSDGFTKVDSDQNIIFAGINARKIIRSLEIGRGSMQIFFKLKGVPFVIESTDLTDRNYYDSVISTLKFSR